MVIIIKASQRNIFQHGVRTGLLPTTERRGWILSDILLLFSCSFVSDFVTPWTAACQDSLSFTISWSLLKLMFIESVMPSFLLLPSIFSNTRVFSNELAFRIRWPKYWSFNFIDYSGYISFRNVWFGFLAVQGTLMSIVQHHSSNASIQGSCDTASHYALMTFLPLCPDTGLSLHPKAFPLLMPWHCLCLDASSLYVLTPHLTLPCHFSSMHWHSSHSPWLLSSLISLTLPLTSPYACLLSMPWHCLSLHPMPVHSPCPGTASHYSVLPFLSWWCLDAASLCSLMPAPSLCSDADCHYSLTAFLSLFHTLLLTVPDAFSLLLAVKLPLTQPRHLFSLYNLKCLSLVPDAFPAGLSDRQCQGMERGKATWCSERQCWDIQRGKASGNSERQCQGIERGKSLGLVRSSVKA